MFTSTKVSRRFPWPSQLFSEILKEKFPPVVPIPAPALISPVDFSVTLISTTFKSLLLPSETFFLTSLKISLAFSSATDFSNFNSLKGSPSSNKSSALITPSSVIVFPCIS